MKVSVWATRAFEGLGWRRKFIPNPRLLSLFELLLEPLETSNIKITIVKMVIDKTKYFILKIFLIFNNNTILY